MADPPDILIPSGGSVVINMFKRYHPYEANCPDKENLIEKWRKLNIEIEKENEVDIEA